MATLDLRDVDDGMFVVAAFRYAIGRRSYAVSCIANVLRRLAPEMLPRDRCLIWKEIEEAIKRQQAGSYIDEDIWRTVQRRLEDFVGPGMAVSE
jgi:hypothetical protein